MEQVKNGDLLVTCCLPRADLLIETIDGELRLLVAIRRTVREAESRPRSTARIDELLDELAESRP
jgi:hypothetical protein